MLRAPGSAVKTKKRTKPNKIRPLLTGERDAKQADRLLISRIWDSQAYESADSRKIERT